MIITSPNPPEIALQIVAQQLNGTPKLDIVSGTVRVYLLGSEGETELLSSTPLTGTDSIWRYVWEPEALAIGSYIIEYTLIDSEDLECISTEDLSVFESSGGGGTADWDALLEDHKVEGSMGGLMNLIYKTIRKYLYGDRYKSS